MTTANSIRTWQYSTGNPVAAVAIDPAGEVIVAGTLGKTVCCLDGTGQQQWQANVGNQAWRVALSADGQTLVTGTGSTRPWDLGGRGLFCFGADGSLHWQVDLKASVWGLALSADGQTIAVGTDARQLLLFDGQGHRLWQHDVPGWGILAWVFGAAVSANGDIIAATVADWGVRILTRSGTLAAEYRTRADVYVVAVSADGSTVATGDTAGNVYWLDRQGRLLWQEQLADKVWAVGLSATGQRLLVGAGEKEAHLRTYDSAGRLVWRRYVGGSVSSLALSADGRRIVAGTDEGSIHIFGEDGHVLHLAQAAKKVREVAISATGEKVVAGSEDGFIYGFQLPLGETDMTGLSTELYQRCRNTLLQCAELDSNATLRAVFVMAELRPFQTGLPEAASKGERVDLCLNFLLSRRLNDGRAALALFMTALHDRYEPGDALREELNVLAQDVTQALGTPPRQTTQPVSSFHQVKIKTLEKRLADLMADYEAANNQLSQVLSEVDRTRLRRQVETLEQEINQVEAELKTLR